MRPRVEVRSPSRRFTRMGQTASPFSPEEWQKVRQFGFDKPERDRVGVSVERVQIIAAGVALVLIVLGFVFASIAEQVSP